jgi:hypothetical protein
MEFVEKTMRNLRNVDYQRAFLYGAPWAVAWVIAKVIWEGDVTVNVVVPALIASAIGGAGFGLGMDWTARQGESKTKLAQANEGDQAEIKPPDA